jgi:hypothetical protein
MIEWSFFGDLSMKKWLFLLVTFYSSLMFGLPIQDRKIDPTALSELAAALDIPVETDLSSLKSA